MDEQDGSKPSSIQLNYAVVDAMTARIRPEAGSFHEFWG
jgi:hypothetical protein